MFLQQVFSMLARKPSADEPKPAEAADAKPDGKADAGPAEPTLSKDVHADDLPR